MNIICPECDKEGDHRLPSNYVANLKRIIDNTDALSDGSDLFLLEYL